MAGEILLFAQVLVAVLMLALAGWLLYVDFGSSRHRAFALLFFLRGSHILINQVARLVPSQADYLAGIRGYFLLGLAAAVINVFIVYTWRPNALTRFLRAALVLGVITLEMLYISDHELLHFTHPKEGPTFGPLGVFTQGFLPLLALLGVWFAIAAARTHVAAQARFHRLMGLAFSAIALADGILAWSIVPIDGWGPIYKPYDHAPHILAQTMYVVTAPIALAAFGILLATTRDGVTRRWILGVGAFCGALPFIGGLLTPPDHDATLTFQDFLLFFLPLGLARLAGACALAYALVRQNAARVDAFALDYRLRLTISRGTIGGVLLAVFFVISKAAENVIPHLLSGGNETLLSQVLGTVGAGLVLLAFRPLQGVADRVSTSILPHARPAKDLSVDDRVALYDEQASIAWADGTLTRKERLLLDRLRERLNLSPDRTSLIEDRVLRRLDAPTRKPLADGSDPLAQNP